MTEYFIFDKEECNRLQNATVCIDNFMITIQQIAAKAKVSSSTVSRALQNPSLVKAETRIKILKLANKFNYICNVTAQEFARRKSKILGLVVPTLDHSVFGLSTNGIQKCAEEKGYQIILGNTNYNPEKQRKIINVFQGRRVDGIILNGSVIEKEIFQKLREEKLPFVITWEENNITGFNIVAFNDFKSSYDATEYLIKLGHRKIAMISGPRRLSGRAMMKWKGYRECLTDHRIQYESSLVIEKFHTLSSGLEATRILLKRKPTAILCGTDVLAIGAMKGIQDIGLIVPDDISIMGYNDSEYARFTTPSLTSVSVPAYEMGKMCSEVLINIIEGKIDEPQKIILETKLVIRDSCGPVLK